MSRAESLPSPSCTHDLGPGTTVCLRCRQEQRDAARANQQKLIAMAGVAAMGLLGVYVLGAGAVNGWRAARPDSTKAVVPARASVVASSVSINHDVRLQGEPAPVSPTATLASLPAADASPAPSAAPSPSAAGGTTTSSATTAGAGSPGPTSPLALIVREGETRIAGDLIAQRSSDSVFVDFDTPEARTRRRDKFDALVRRTLPLLYGAAVDSVLRTIPAGGIVGDADLLTELPQRGVHLRVAQGWTLDLWPQTRPGQDGPLVVAYTARVTRDGALR